MAVFHKAASQYLPDPEDPANAESFNWSHNGGPDDPPVGALVFVYSKTNIDLAYCVSYGGIELKKVGSITSINNGTNLGTISAWFTGKCCPGGVQSIGVSRYVTGEVDDIMYASAVTFGANYFTDVVSLIGAESNSTLAQVLIDDLGKSPGPSLRYAAMLSAVDNNVAEGPDSTLLNTSSLDSAFCAMARETIAGEDIRPVGFLSTVLTNSVTLHLAVREIPRHILFYS